MILEEKIIIIAIKAAIAAGKEIMKYYDAPFHIEYKKDDSPLTIADKKANEVILSFLKPTQYPILSEEGKQIDFDLRCEWDIFWLVDPLDGTKEFIKKNGDFTVNIALIENGNPIFGVIYTPVQQTLYWGTTKGSFLYNVNKNNDIADSISMLEKDSIRLPFINDRSSFIVVGSRSHMNQVTELFIAKLSNEHSELEFVSRGSSLKFCTLAEGNADIYPRFGPTMEWDTAAGHAIALYAGCKIENAETHQPIIYNKENLLNPYFIAYR